MADILASVDFGSVAAAVVAAGILIIGIRMAMKGVDVGKTIVGKA